jgi:hypothetical protein
MADKHHHGEEHHQPHHEEHHEHRFSSEDDAPSADPYPYVYSKDPLDERRWNRWSTHGPSVYRVGRIGVLVSYAIIGGVALLVVLAIIAQATAGR